MKNPLLFTFALLFTLFSFAQNGINYKALVKDNLGNVVANQTIDIQFIILEGATNVYQETHTPTTDANGFAIVNIGEGTTADVFTDINWANDDHFLNVQVNTGSGLVDMGTTQFMAVPYALNVSGLEALDEGNGLGWRLKGKDPQFYGNIGEYAVDLSDSDLSDLGPLGALGKHAFAAGYLTNVPGEYAVATGFRNQAIGNSATAMGSFCTALRNNTTALGYYSSAIGIFSTSIGATNSAFGDYSIAFGFVTNSYSYAETTLGAYNTEYVPFSTSSWDSNDRLLVVGNGTSSSNRNNALTVLKNGNVGLVTDSPDAKLHISEGNDTGLGSNNGYVLIGETNSTNISIDNNEIMARNNGNSSDLNLQIEGGNVLVGGEIKVNHVVNSGVAMSVNGDEAIWYNGTYFSWGFGGSTNYFSNNVGIGITNPNAQLDVNGNIEYTGTITDVSDKRLKENFEPISNPIERIQSITGYTYIMKGDTNKIREYGVIAQDVQKMFPEMVRVINDEGHLGVSYIQLIPVLLEAIKEQQIIIDVQDKENVLQNEELRTLTNNYKTLLSRIETLETNISN